METKVCFKCGRELPLDEFYKHPRMTDGHLNKCKECTKSDTKRDYDRKAKDDIWVEKERARGREKYHRIGYKDRFFKTGKMNRFLNNANRDLRVRGFDMDGKEAHHWNYNKPKSVIILSRKAHHRIHKFITVNREDKFCYTIDGECLDTEDKTLKYYAEVLSRYDDLNEKLEIINF